MGGHIGYDCHDLYDIHHGHDRYNELDEQDGYDDGYDELDEQDGHDDGYDGMNIKGMMHMINDGPNEALKVFHLINQCIEIKKQRQD